MSKESRAEFNKNVGIALDRFIQRYPAAFFPKDSTDTRPLAIGIFILLTGQNPDLGRRVVAVALDRYTSKDRYLRALAMSAHRFDLEGRVSGEVSERHRAHAIMLLAERQAKQMAIAA